MANELEKKAKEAFFDDDFTLALDLYSQALNLDPTNADLFADRAQAHIKLNEFTGSDSLLVLFMLRSFVYIYLL